MRHQRGAVFSNGGTAVLFGTKDINEDRDKSTREAEQKIKTLYRIRYLHNPHVTVFVKEQVSGKITFMGAVKKPGTQPLLGRQNLFEALALAEGLSDNAGEMVQVRRTGADPHHPATFLVDLDELNSGRSGKDLNMEIKSGDVIYVPEAGMVYFDVKDRDIIFVETNKMEVFSYGLRVTGLGGIVGVGYEPPRPQ